MRSNVQKSFSSTPRRIFQLLSIPQEKIQGNYSVDRSTREKLAVASSETYKVIRTDMDEIIKTSDWRKARGVGFTEVYIRTNTLKLLAVAVGEEGEGSNAY